MTLALRVYRFLLLLLAMALATIAIGWAGVLLVACGFAVMDRGERVPWETARAAGAAWAAFLLFRVIPSVVTTDGGPSMVPMVAEAMGLPSFVPPLVTIAFPALLAWAAATVTVAALHLTGRPRRAAEPARLEG